MSSWPSGHVADAADLLMGRNSLNVAPQAPQRNWYIGMHAV